MFFLRTKDKTIIHWLIKFSSICKIPHFPLRRKVGQLSKRKRVLCWSIYIISLWRFIAQLGGPTRATFNPPQLPRSTTTYWRAGSNMFDHVGSKTTVKSTEREFTQHALTVPHMATLRSQWWWYCMYVQCQGWWVSTLHPHTVKKFFTPHC